MKLKSNIFFKLFGLMFTGFLIVFIIQFLGRILFFEDMYIEQNHQRNIQDMNEVAESINQGGDIGFIIDDLDLTDTFAYIAEEDEIFTEFIEFEDWEDDDIDDIDHLFTESNGVHYLEYNQPDFDATFTLYFKELDDGDYLVFEHYLYGLTIANQALSMIDLYVILGMIFFLIPYTYWYSRRFSKPLVSMNKQLNDISKLKFNEPLPVTSNDEIGELAKSINSVSKSLEESINKLQNDIEFEQYKDKKRRELIASLSHELKTPITTLRAVTESMIDNIGKYSNRDVYLKESLDHLRYMETLSKDLIEAINIESKRVIKEPTSLQSIYNSSLRYVKDHIKAKKQELTAKIDDVDVIVNSEMMMRVFINILGNASKYSPENAKISVNTNIKNDNVVIEIRNSGAYINPGDITHLFEPFYRVEKSRSKETGGSGLGLFIIKSILDQHNSTYDIRNEIDDVVFRFTLPIDTKVTS